MESQYIQHLIEKVLKGDASTQECETLDRWYRLENEREILWPNSGESSSIVEQRMFSKIKEHISGHSKSRGLLKRHASVGVAALLALTFSIITYFVLSDRFSENKTITSSLSNSSKSMNQNRYIILPDSSKVLLHSGSKITYAFSTKARKVSLIGEAYFEVFKDRNRPFIVSAGHFKTTVLGTAFNVKAYEGEPVVVSVTEGRVRIDDANRKTVAILTDGQELKEDKAIELPNVINKINISTEREWIGKDMKFSDVTFGEIGRLLEFRYNVRLHFVNRQIESCLINGGFDGLESLSEVMSVLCQTVDAQYNIADKDVYIYGRGCKP